MNRTRKPNAMLIELVIVILFFSISAGIILQLFVAAKDRNVQNDVNSTALLIAEDTVERLAASDERIEAFFEADGWDGAAEHYQRTMDVSGRTLVMHAKGETERTDAGRLDVFELTVMDGDRLAATLPMSRYMPEEGAP